MTRPSLENLSSRGYYNFLKSLEEVDFSDAKKGSFKVISRNGCISVQKIDDLAIEHELVAGEKSTNLSPEEIDKSVKLILEELNSEVEKIQFIAKNNLIEGKKVKADAYMISTIQQSSLIKLKSLVSDPSLKDNIERLSQSLEEIKSAVANPANLILKEAMLIGNLDLAGWSIRKGADLAILDDTSIPNQLSKEAVIWLKTMGANKPFDAANVEYYAIEVGWGYKAANAKLMEHKLQQASEGMVECEAHAPSLEPISDFQIWEYLKSDIPELGSLWEKFLDSFDPESRRQFLKAHDSNEAARIPVKITRKGEAILEEIQAKIVKQFQDKKYSSMLLQDWLKTHDPSWVIVRSTGKEDSDTAANAGGNASIPFVAPNEEAISLAMGEVIASYFGEKSIIQRLQAGDKSVFTEKPFLPVLVQEMICEPNLGGRGSEVLDIPRSGVLFTKQPGRADDVVVVNTALGSNEGVVSSQVVVDTYAVHPKGIHSVIRDKEIRFVQDQIDGKIHVGPIKNTSMGLRQPPSLTNQMARDLATLATNFARMYGGGKVKAMDFEYTILMKPKKISETKTIMIPVIYPLQIRPLLSTENLNPSFLKLDEVAKLRKENQESVTTLLSGDCSTVEIDNPAEQVIIADDLPQALSKYQKAANPALVRLIVTRSSAPLASHEAVTISRTHIPVLPAITPEKYNKIKRLMEKANRQSPCFADPQRSLIVHGEGKKLDEVVGKGLIAYPGPREYSLPIKPRNFSCLRQGMTSLERSNALNELYRASNEMISAHLKEEDINRLSKYTIRELMDKVAMSEIPEAQKALAFIARLLLQTSLYKNRDAIRDQIIVGDPALADEFLKSTIRLYEEVYYLMKNELFPALNDPVKYPPQSMNRLFYLKPIDALLFQEGSLKVLESHSFRNIEATTRGLLSLGSINDRYGIPRDYNNLWLIAIGKLGYRREIREDWYQFLAGLNDNDKRILISTLKKLDELGIQESFVNIQFRDAWKAKNGKPDAVFQSLMASVERETATLDWLLEKQVPLKGMEEQVGYWGLPSFVEKNLSKLPTRVRELGFTDESGRPGELVQKYANASPLAKLAILAYARRAVTAYDASIKSLTASTLFDSPQQKARSFVSILRPYSKMMESMMSFIDSRSRTRLMGNDEGYVRYDFDQYKLGLQNGVNYAHGDLFKDINQLPEDMRESIYEGEISWRHPALGPMNKFCVSRGFEGIAREVQSEGCTPETAEREFIARSKFSVDNFIPGSKLDRDYSVHWPNRLEEYFTTYHQIMEKIIKTEQTKNGLTLNVLPSSLQATCNFFNSKFGVEPSSINKSAETLEVIYEVPLRQHAARITFSMNAHRTDTPIIMEIKASGVEESDRWKRTAALSALISNRLGLPFHFGAPPEILYTDPSQVSFTIEIPRNYLKLEELIEKVRVMLKENTMQDPVRDHSISPEEGFELSVVRGDDMQFGAFLEMNSIEDWADIPGQFYAEALYLNLFLLDHFVENKDLPNVLKIIENTIEGLQNYSLQDYVGTYKSKYTTPNSASLVDGMNGAIDHFLAENLSEEDRTKLDALKAKIQKLQS